VTSGTLSPTLGKSIAMAYIDANFAAEGTALQADLKSVANPAKVVKLPFYNDSSTGVSPSSARKTRARRPW